MSDNYIKVNKCYVYNCSWNISKQLIKDELIKCINKLVEDVMNNYAEKNNIQQNDKVIFNHEIEIWGACSHYYDDEGKKIDAPRIVLTLNKPTQSESE
jgi:hypothetical protein